MIKKGIITKIVITNYNNNAKKLPKPTNQKLATKLPVRSTKDRIKILPIQRYISLVIKYSTELSLANSYSFAVKGEDKTP